MINLEYRGTLRDKKGGFKGKFYFGEPAPNPVYIEHWKYGIPGKISFKGSTLIFTAENFTPSQPMRNQLLEPYFKYYNSVGTLLLKLDLRELRKVTKSISSQKSHNRITLRFYVHGSFLEDNIKDLNFSIRCNRKEGVTNLLEEINKAKNSKDFDPEAGSLRFIED